MQRRTAYTLWKSDREGLRNLRGAAEAECSGRRPTFGETELEGLNNSMAWSPRDVELKFYALCKLSQRASKTCCLIETERKS